MNFVINNLEILSTLGSALTIYFAIRKAASKDAIKIKEEMKETRVELKDEMKEMKDELKAIKISIQALDSRVSRIEGQLMGSPRWEPKIVNNEEKK